MFLIFFYDLLAKNKLNSFFYFITTNFSSLFFFAKLFSELFWKFLDFIL